MSSPPLRVRARGFTLIEILVALSAGVLVTISTFMLSKNATTFFQREARVSSAQLALTLAMNRLTNDIQRAAYLSTANALVDPQVCRTTALTWPTGLNLLTGIAITAGPAMPQTAQQVPAMIPPDIITIGGSMDSTEMFQIQSIVAGSGGAPLLTMRGPTMDPATYRALATLGPPDALQSRLTPTFYPSTYPYTYPVTVSSGRFAHIFHPATNFHMFGVIDSFTVDTISGAVKVQLLPNPTVPVQGTSTCGIAFGDTGGGWLFSVVTRAQYSIQNVVAAPPVQLAQILSPPSGQVAAVTGDTGRTELVRTELDANNAPIPTSMELVAEYAVDLRFGITVSTQIIGDNYAPSVTSYGINDANVYALALAAPQRIRAVQVRLSTRTRAPDRDTDLPVGPDGRRLRFLVGPFLQPAYARVRTNYANVALPNQGGFSLW